MEREREGGREGGRRTDLDEDAYLTVAMSHVGGDGRCVLFLSQQHSLRCCTQHPSISLMLHLDGAIRAHLNCHCLSLNPESLQTDGKCKHLQINMSSEGCIKSTELASSLVPKELATMSL